MANRPQLTEAAERYCTARKLAICRELGHGVHGIVFDAKGQAVHDRRAIKIHERETCYTIERDIYLRLADRNVLTTRGANVPELLAFDDTLLILEMSIVQRPYVLDFAGALIDREPDFSEDVLMEWQAEKREQFGSQWSEAQKILRALAGMGIHLIDVNPNNIALGP